jgi:hypothetical protein
MILDPQMAVRGRLHRVLPATSMVGLTMIRSRYGPQAGLMKRRFLRNVLPRVRPVASRSGGARFVPKSQKAGVRAGTLCDSFIDTALPG